MREGGKLGRLKVVCRRYKNRTGGRLGRELVKRLCLFDEGKEEELGRSWSEVVLGKVGRNEGRLRQGKKRLFIFHSRGSVEEE